METYHLYPSPIPPISYILKLWPVTILECGDAHGSAIRKPLVRPYGQKGNPMATLPHSAHGDTLPVVKIGPKYEGKGEARHIVGTQLYVLLLFDNCAQAPTTVLGPDPTLFPPPEVVAERNMKADFLKARFTDLVITFSGGDYGAINYRGTASNAEILPNK